MKYTMVYLARGLSIFMDSNSLSIANYYFWNLKSDHSHIYIYIYYHPPLTKILKQEWIDVYIKFAINRELNWHKIITHS